MCFLQVCVQVCTESGLCCWAAVETLRALPVRSQHTSSLSLGGGGGRGVTMHGKGLPVTKLSFPPQPRPKRLLLVK